MFVNGRQDEPKHRTRVSGTAVNESSTPSAPDVVPAHDAEPPLAHRVVRGGLWVAASSYFNIGFGFLATLVLTRLLAPEDFGVFALAGFFFSFINLRPKIGIGYAFAQRKETTGKLAGSYLALDVSAGLATLLLSAAAVPVLRVFGYPWDVALVVLAFAGVGISDSVTGTAWVLLEKELHFGRASAVNSVMFPLSYAPAFYLAVRGGGFWSLIAQNATYALLLLVGMWWTSRRCLPHIWRLHWQFDRETAIGLLRFGVVVGVAGMANMFVGQLDNFLVGTFVGLATLGFYERAYRIAQWPTALVTGVISRTAFYTYARLQSDPLRVQRAVTMTLWLITALALPLALAIFVAAPDLIRLLYGDRWLQSSLFLRFLIAYSVIRPLLDDVGSLFVAIGRPRLTAVVSITQAITLAAVGTALTLRFGAPGTCVAVGVTFSIGLLLTYRYAVRLIAIRLWDALGWPAVAALVTMLGYFILVRPLIVGTWPLVIAVAGKMVYASLTYFAVTFALRPRATIERATYVWRLAWTRE